MARNTEPDVTIFLRISRTKTIVHIGIFWRKLIVILSVTQVFIDNATDSTLQANFN